MFHATPGARDLSAARLFYATFAALFFATAVGLALAMFVLGLPGRIAIARNHPDADAVNAMGWVGFLAVVPWIQALIWAFKPTDIIDIRNLPREERRETLAMIARLKGKPAASALAPETPTGEDKTP